MQEVKLELVVDTYKQPMEEWARGRKELLKQLDQELLASGFRILSGDYVVIIRRVTTK